MIKSVSVLLLVAGFFFSCGNATEKKIQADSTSSVSEDSVLEKQYSPKDLNTNFSKHAVPLDQIQDGGPGKNGIPAIDFPRFVSVTDARKFLSEPDFGILLQKNGEQKFYSFNILNWHEVVNDAIGDEPVCVSFCPLCGSAMVFDRVIDGDTLLFGVSGKLFESNLLMFDDKTESLWSQAMGEAVAGDMSGKKLQLVNSVVISFEEILKSFPDAEVLSSETGFDRNYSQYPYADYNSNEDLYFPVSKHSDRFNNKDMMYVVQTGKTSVAFSWKNLLASGNASQKTPDGTVEVTVKNFVPSSVNKETGQPLNGYFSYWFSWYTVKGDKGIVWGK